MRDGHGNILKWYGILADVEDRKRAEEERERLRQLEADLAHINRVSMLGELAASIAHEVKQPLAGVVSNASAGLRWRYQAGAAVQSQILVANGVVYFGSLDHHVYALSA